jgi:tetratricopeptide (TPR) repeat protein
MKKNFVFIIAIILILIMVVISFGVVRFSIFQLNSSSQSIEKDSRQISNIGKISSRLHIAIFSKEIDAKDASMELRRSLVDNILIKNQSVEEQDDWETQFFKLIQSIIEGEGTKDYTEELEEGFLLVRLRDYFSAIILYEQLLSHEDISLSVEVPSLIFLAFSQFMVGNPDIALGLLYQAKSKEVVQYYDTISYLERRILNLVRIRNDLIREESVESGKEFLKTLDFSEALDILEDQLEGEQKNESLFYIARIQEELGNFDAALQIYDYLILTDDGGEDRSAFRGYIVSQYYTESPTDPYVQYLEDNGREDLLSLMERDVKHLNRISPELTEGRVAFMAESPEEWTEFLVEPIPEPIPEETSLIYVAPLPVVEIDEPIEEVVEVVVEVDPVIPSEEEEPVEVVVEPVDNGLPMLTEEQIKEARRVSLQEDLQEIKEQIEETKLQLEEEQMWQDVRTTSSIAGYSTSAVSLGFAAYNGYQVLQVQYLVSQGIDPTTVQGITTDVTGATESALISGGIMLGSLTLSLAMNGYDWWINKTDEKKEMMSNAIEQLERDAQLVQFELEELQ